MKKKTSLAFRLGLIMSLIVASTLFISALVNTLFLEKYYKYQKQKEMISAYNTICAFDEAGKLKDSSFTDVTFRKLTQEGNMSIVISMDDSSYISSMPEVEMSEMIFEFNTLYQVAYGDALKEVKVEDEYSLYNQVDKRLDTEYYVMVGNLPNEGYRVMIRTAVESIKESAQVTNKFFQLVGIGAVLVGLIVIIFLSKGISKPIASLSEISNSMCQLDFSAKYVPKKTSSREVDELGVHINQLSETLESTISELKIANNQLMADIQKKEQIDEMRKEFISNVSHELKTPLALIAGYAEGLQDGINDDQESKDFYCEVIIDETEKMTKMVKKLLTLNQLEFGYDVVDMKRFDITELITGVINASSIIISQKAVTVNFENDGPAYVWGDEFKIEEVVTNYVSNALNHIDYEKVINIRYELREKALRVIVFNTGDHIPEEDIDKVWEKFYKVDKARTREYGGNGIGLSIVKAIMDSHHQQCGVNNADGGVEFWFELDRNI